jgi:hypothetical protein
MEVKRTYNKGEFIARALEVHGIKYDYTAVNYKYSKERVIVTCKSCLNSFKITPMKHLQGQGCVQCMTEHRLQKIRKKNLLKFIENSPKSMRFFTEDFINNNTKIRGFCTTHRRLAVKTPRGHIKHGGCDFCSSLRYAKNAGRVLIHKKCSYLYIMRFQNEVEDFLKLGVSSDPYARRRSLRFQASYNITIEKVYKFTSRVDQEGLEGKLLLGVKKYFPQEFFNGRTECFLSADLNWCIDVINQSEVQEVT